MAFTVPLCEHIKTNGIQCGSPALSGENYCYAHRAHHAPHRKRAFCFDPNELPVLEDGTSIQVALMNVLRAMMTGALDHRRAGLILYGLQIASSNLRRCEFEPEEFSTNPKPAATARTQRKSPRPAARATAPEVPNAPEDLAALARLINFAFPEEAPANPKLLPSAAASSA